MQSFFRFGSTCLPLSREHASISEDTSSNAVNILASPLPDNSPAAAVATPTPVRPVISTLSLSLSLSLSLISNNSPHAAVVTPDSHNSSTLESLPQDKNPLATFAAPKSCSQHRFPSRASFSTRQSSRRRSYQSGKIHQPKFFTYVFFCFQNQPG